MKRKEIGKTPNSAAPLQQDTFGLSLITHVITLCSNCAVIWVPKELFGATSATDKHGAEVPSTMTVWQQHGLKTLALCVHMEH